MYESLPLLAQGEPHPEPGDHLEEEEGEGDPVLEGVAAPCARCVRRVVGARVGEAPPRVDGGEEGGGGAREEGVEEDDHEEEGADGS